MFDSVLIANRGEIARRVIRTARRLNIRTIAVYSDADVDALHVREADHAVHIGPAPARESYLMLDNILRAAQQSGAEAIHPGYGFLSENADFAEKTIQLGVSWIGPPPSAIKAMGLKHNAKHLMREVGVAVTPGYMGEAQSETRLLTEAEAIGYPVLIKAVAGGGGKGMRKVVSAEDFVSALQSCKREAIASFGDDRVLLEKYISCPRHIEVQLFADNFGNVVHLFERDCSLQRRHQKIIEESPAPGMNAETRATICSAAIRAAKAVKYQGAGTVEFIADASEGLRPDRIWFMEMNTRLQVEHPVTEAVTGLDLVEWQFRIASGESLPLRQDEIRLNGHAMEARLYAENTRSGFLPSTGRLQHFCLPDNVRVDSAAEPGGIITSYYDPMIAKLITHEPTRKIAAAKLAQACESIEVWPVQTNAGFLARCLNVPDFVDGAVDTGFVSARLQALTMVPAPSQDTFRAAVSAFFNQNNSTVWSQPALSGLRLNTPEPAPILLDLNGEELSLSPRIGLISDCKTRSFRIGENIIVFEKGEAFAFTPTRGSAGAPEQEVEDGAIRSPMPGRIVDLPVIHGELVVQGQPLVTLEAMKMEHVMKAPFDAIVAKIHASLGDHVTESTLLLSLEKQDQ
jgi:3-methylcrotonyl-CoA carboxylase alpha subunit